jgi:hypothetical protein
MPLNKITKGVEFQAIQAMADRLIQMIPPTRSSIWMWEISVPTAAVFLSRKK